MLLPSKISQSIESRRVFLDYFLGYKGINLKNYLQYISYFKFVNKFKVCVIISYENLIKWVDLFF